MKLSTSLLCLSAMTPVIVEGFKYERLDKDDALLLIVDHQVGLFNLVHDWDPTIFSNAMIAHATIAKAFDLPVVMTTSAETGPNGPLPGEIRKLYPDAPIISRHGEVNAWDNKDFREAVRAANKSQIIVGGIVTEVCTTFLALSLREAGYSVWANVEASGTMSTIARDTGNDRMKDAGVHLVSLFAIFGELMRHWGNVPGGKELFPWLDRFVPQVSFVVRQHQSAIKDGEIAPGEEDLNEGRKIDW